jgi:hypothetical protein
MFLSKCYFWTFLILGILVSPLLLQKLKSFFACQQPREIPILFYFNLHIEVMQGECIVIFTYVLIRKYVF